MMDGNDLVAGRRDVLALAAGSAMASWPMGVAAKHEPAPRGQQSGNRAIPFDDGWRFHRGTGEGFAAMQMDDRAWRTVDLPHDWSIEDIPASLSDSAVGPFDKQAEGGTATGFTRGGEGWYRKHFRVDTFPADARIELLFDGAYLDSEIWLNGRSLGGSVHGYTAFAVDLTPWLDRSGNNVVAVHVGNEGRNSRWYSGSGLYRSVELAVSPKGTRISRDGVAGWTRRLANGRAEIEVRTAIEAVEPGYQLVTRLRDETGQIVAESTAPATVQVEQLLVVRGPRLWSADQPRLHSLEVELRRDGEIVDALTQDFGIRIVAFAPNIGMTVNGEAVKLRGGCIHHDNGLLGACAYRDADERRIRLLKARGYNAIRSAHNPSSKSLRRACDRIGMYLIEEAFDSWHVGKEPQDFTTRFPAHWQDVIGAMVRSARNSPSVIMWSIGNEIPYRATDEGVEWQWKLANAVKRIDPTRPVTAGLNGVLGAPMIAADGTARPERAGKVDNGSTIFLDVPGYNYRLEDIEAEQERHPERIVYASETFARDVYDYQSLSDRAPYFLGEFLWTAMDYLGEAGIGTTAQLKNGGFPIYLPSYPWVNAWCGDIDLIGQQKAASLARDVVWGVSPLEMTVQRPLPDGMFEYVASWGWSDELASWTWPGAEGQVVAVRLYCAGDRVELRLNGQVVGGKNLTAADKMRCEFTLPYAPGVLEAIAWRGRRIIGRRRLTTAGPATRLRCVVEGQASPSDRQGLRYLMIEVLDDQGRILPDDQRKVRLSIDGPATLAAFGSANPLATGSVQGRETLTFRGRALAILRSQGRPGTVRVSVEADGLKGASAIMTMT